MGVTGSMGSAIQGIHSELSIRKGPCVIVSVWYEISSAHTCYCHYCTNTPASSYDMIYDPSSSFLSRALTHPISSTTVEVTAPYMF